MIKVTAAGRLVKDAMVFTYGDGYDQKTGLNFSLACNTRRKEEPVYINCTYFGPDEKLAQYLLMGNQVIITGDLDIYPDKNGNYYTKIMVQELEFGAIKQ